MNRILLAAALAAIATPSAIGAKPALAAAASQSRYDHLSTVRLGSKGSPVILVPGLATPRAVWDGFASTLARTHRVYVVQVNGFGGDDAGVNASGPVIPGVVDDLHRFIARDRLAGAAVVGHSMGGLVAMRLAIQHPADVGRLMIVDSLPFFGVLAAAPGQPVTAKDVEPTARALRDAVRGTYGKPSDPATIERQTAGMAIKPGAAALVRAWAPKADARVTAQAMYEDMTTDLRSDIAQIHAPITLVYPWHAGPFTAEQTASFYRSQYKLAPQTQFVEIRDAAHFVMLDQPEAFAKALENFLL